MLKAMDDAIGRVMDALDRKGVLDDTLIMFLNDNGGESEAGGNSPYRGLKESRTWRAASGSRPSFAGRSNPGRVGERCANACGRICSPHSPGWPGRTPAPACRLMDWMSGRRSPTAPRVRDGSGASLDVIRVGDWKLLEEGANYQLVSSWTLQLYNIAEDPYETTNLASSEPARRSPNCGRASSTIGAFARDAEPGAPIPGLDSIDSY